jgi:hypothetical protein
MTHTEIANLIPDETARRAWLRAGMPTDLGVVAQLVQEARKAVVHLSQSHPIVRRGHVAPVNVTSI